MAVFNVSFLNPKLRTSGAGEEGISVLMNQLTILENDLQKDGYLAPADYDILLDKAQKLQSTPGLTANQRSRIDVKVSDLTQQKSNSAFDRSGDLDEMNDVFKNEAFEDVIMAGSDPLQFLNGRVASLQAKAEQLQEEITRRETSGQDVSDHMNEYNETINNLQDRFRAIDGMSNAGDNPVDGYAAFVTTNNRGEIVDVDYNRFNSRSGYVETDGMINGFQVFAKPNKKEGGKNVFIIGNETFSAVDSVVPDPLNPGSFKPQALRSESRQSGGIFKTARGGSLFNIPSETLQTQSYIPRNSWAKGVDGSVYKRLESGGYQKYLNARPEDIDGYDPARALNIPRQYEQGISRNVTETIDASETIAPDTGLDLTTPQTGGALGPRVEAPPSEIPSLPGQAQTAATQVRNRAGAPTERAPSGFFQNAANTARSAKDFVKGIFSR